MTSSMMVDIMVRKPKALKQVTDGKPDPAFQDLYIPRQKGDPTGQSQIINDQEDALDYELPTVAGEQVAQNATRTASPISLGQPTRFQSEPNTAGISQGPGVGRIGASPMATDLDAYLQGLFSRFNDPVILELIEQKNAVPVQEKPQTRFR